MRLPFEIGGTVVPAGTQVAINLPIPALYTHNPMSCPVYVIHGKKPGPILFLSGAIHGDEINGMEIIRRVLNRKILQKMTGTLVAVPVVNILGFVAQNRYLPDRRDLNRSFPGSKTGSLAARMANLFLEEIVKKCTHGIDLHTAAIHRDNFPQVRAEIKDPEIARMAVAFNAPVMVNTPVATGTLRSAASALGVSVIVYEAGEALRFDEVSIRAGVKGIISTMRELGMLAKPKVERKENASFVASSSFWIRTPKSGILRASKSLGAKVEKGEILGVVSDPFGSSAEQIIASHKGIIIGRTNIPLVNEGEALFHIARFEDAENVSENVEGFQDEMNPARDSLRSAEPPIV